MLKCVHVSVLAHKRLAPARVRTPPKMSSTIRKLNARRLAIPSLTSTSSVSIQNLFFQVKSNMLHFTCFYFLFLFTFIHYNDVSAVTGEKAQRRGSVGSLDSGMSVSFQSTSASTCSRSDKLAAGGGAGKVPPKSVYYQHSFLGGLFNKKQASLGNAPPTTTAAAVAKSTEV